MGSDAEAVRDVMSWACGFLVLILGGVGLPLLLSFIPDALGLWRRHGVHRPFLVLLGLIVGVIVLMGYEVSLTGAPSTPSTTLWLTLTVLLGVAVGIAALLFAASRGLRRRAERRQALAIAMSPPVSDDAMASGPKPVGVPRLNARAAEHLACAWMRYLGAAEAVVTPEQRDGGVDIRSSGFVAQVKNLQNEQVGVAVVRELYGVAAAERRRALFFSSSGYTRDALAFARENGVALFVVRYREGRLVPHGSLAQQYLDQGLRALSQR